jgi:Flp pilus assembly protein TadD
MAKQKSKPAAKNIPPPTAPLPVGSRLNAFFHTTIGWWTLCGLLAALVVWTFWPSVHGQFLFYDEYGYLIVNRHVNQGFTWSGFLNSFVNIDYSNWVPLVWMTHMLDFTLYGAHPWGHHLTNIILHTLNTIVLFWLLKRLTGNLWTSLVGVLIFALHPLRVESVTWISERKDVLSLFFGLLTLCAHVRYAGEIHKPDGRPKLFYILTLLAFIFCLMSKSMLVTLPCVMLLLDFWPLERWRQERIGRLLLEKLPFFLIVIPIAIVAGMAEKRGGDLFMTNIPFPMRLETAFMSYVRLLGWLFWPHNLSAFYPYPHSWPLGRLLLAGIVVLGVSLAALLQWRRRPYLLVGWFWYLGAMFPVLGLVVQVNAQSTANHYTYYPMIGLALLLACSFSELSQRWPNRAIVVALLVALGAGVCIVRTRAEIAYFMDDITLYKHAIVASRAYDDCNFMGHCDLGILIAGSDPDRSLAELQRSVEINPHYPEAERSLATTYMQYSRFADAADMFKKASGDNPHDSRTWLGLASACAQLGRTDEAIPYFQKGLSMDPNNLDILNGLGITLAQKGRLAEALPLLNKVCALAPSNPNAFNNLGIVAANAGQFDVAIVAFQNALKLAPDSTGLQANLKAVLQAQQRASASNAPPAVPTSPPPGS